MNILFVPLLLQGACIFADEIIFHRRRGLPTWEVWGHPLDTATVLIAYLFLISQPFSALNAWIYGGICVFSCLFVTKDEFLHVKLCTPMEQWLHAVLFLLHPIAFMAGGFIWYQGGSPFLLGQCLLVTFFLLFQVFYWSWRCRQPLK